jgi:2-polyprenyl-3-methyl-5-hydroxy-6-metoxy-1,4-benzoquinol methylase
MQHMHTITNKDLLAYLKSIQLDSGFLDRLKVYYRPLICPFSDLIGLVNKGDKVGDVGCGSGQFCLLLAHFAEPSFVYGIEINERLITNANLLFRKESKVEFQFEQFDGKHFPDKLQELDIIFLNDVLHHVPKNMQQNFIQSLIKMMKPGARLVLKDINADSLFVYFNKLHDTVFAGEIGNEIGFKQANQWLSAENLIILHSSKKQMYVYPHYTIVAKKP